MRIFNKVVFICNVCFIAAVFLRWIEMNNKKDGPFTGNVIPLPALQNMLVLLGYGAIILNLLFCIICIIRLLTKGNLFLPKWVSIFNLLIFPAQVWYFFFSKM